MKYQHKHLCNLSLGLFIIVSLLACGGGNKSSASVDTTVPLITAFSPANHANAVDTSVSIGASFNEDMFATTITNNSFTLKNTLDEILPARVYFDATNNKVTLTPTAELALLNSYTATLTSDITDLAGNALEETSWEFTIRDEGSIKIETSDEFMALPKIATDANGNALAVWAGNDSNLWSNRYNKDTGWENAQLIPIKPHAFHQQPFPLEIAFDNNGNALAVWTYYSEGGTDNVWSNQYSKDTGWATAQFIVTSHRSTNDFNVAFATDGNAIAVWSQNNGTSISIWSNRYNKDNRWETAQLIQTDISGVNSFPQIAIDTNGNAMAVWSHNNGTSISIWSNRYNKDTGWETARLFDTDINAKNALSLRPQIAMDANGNTLAVWSQTNGGRFYIFSNQYNDDTGWGTPQKIDNNLIGDALHPQIAFGNNGNALAVWEQYNGSRFSGEISRNVWSNLYNKNTGWESARLIQTDNTESGGSNPQIVFDNNGNAFAVWGQFDGSLWLNRHNKDNSWGTSQLIARDALYYRIAIDTTDKAFVIWSQHDGTTSNIRVNIFK